MTRTALSQLATSTRNYDHDHDYEVFIAKEPAKGVLVIPLQQSTAKRKGTTWDSTMNPLLANALAKKAQKSSAANKRKLNTTEDGPNERAIVHAPPPTTYDAYTRASSSQPSLQPPPAKPPAKKFRAESQPLTSTSQPRPNSQQNQRKPTNRFLDAVREDGAADDAANHSDADLERDVRAMEDEADRLRRISRAHSTINPSIHASTPKTSASNNNNNARFQFAPPSSALRPPAASGTKKPPSRGKPRGKSAAASGDGRPATPTMDVDSRVPIAESETPQIQRNKRLREGAMAAIADMEEADGDSRSGRSLHRNSTNHRRRSSLSRGKRISTSFEATGVITQPHNSVSENSFYKHIDAELPDVERIRQLLIWCALRAASRPSSTTPPPSGPSTSTSAPHAPSLPPLSAEAQKALKKTQDDFVRMLAEKRVNLSTRDPNPPTPTKRGKDESENVKLKENEQNVRNRMWEVTYSSHIQRAQAEDEAWKKVSYEYDAYCKRLHASAEKRKRAFQSFSASSSAKGKGRASEAPPADGDIQMGDAQTDGTNDEKWLDSYPKPRELPPDFQRGAELARTVLIHSRRRHKRPHTPPNAPTPTDTSTSTPSRRRSLSRASLATQQAPSRASTGTIEEQLLAALPTLQYKLDTLHTYVHAARATTLLCERILDDRFRALNRVLDRRGRVGRSSSVPPPPSAGEGEGGVSRSHVLTTYIRRSPSPSRSLHPSSSAFPGGLTTNGAGSRSQSVPPMATAGSSRPSPHTLLRALTQIDARRPPAQVGDAARRAARRVVGGEGGVVGDSRVTVLPGMVSGGAGGGGGLVVPGTPRRGAGGVPGTPGRRTPARDRTPGRERTPAR